MAVVLAKDAEAGRRYRVQDTGDIVEVCARPSDARNSRLVPLTTADGSFVHVNAISHKNQKILNRDPSNPLVIPAFFKLEPYEGPYHAAPNRRLVVPRSLAPKSHKAGRKPKGDTPWRGWAYNFQHDLESLLEVIEAEGFWVKPAFHYFRVGYQSQTCLGVFKAGQLGFPDRPEGILGTYPARRRKGDNYMTWKTDLGPIMSTGKWPEMVTLLQRYLREFKVRVSKQNRRGAR